MNVQIDIDLFGNQSDLCLGLGSLVVLLRLQAGILCGVLEHGDGVMIVRITPDMQRWERLWMAK